MNSEQMLEEQDLTLLRIIEIAQEMRDYTVTRARLKALEEEVLTLGQLEDDLDVQIGLEDKLEEEMLQREEEQERMRAIDATQF